jgi:hypothetical protein
MWRSIAEAVGKAGSAALRQRALEALAGHVGSVDRVRGSIEAVCRIVEDVAGRHGNKQNCA